MMFFIKKNRTFMVEEKDITTILSVVGHEANVIHYDIGNCGWADQPSRWFISFYTTNKRYSKIMKKLTGIGTFTTHVRPGGQVDLWFDKT